MQNTGEFLFTYVYTYERAAAIYVHLSNFFCKTGDGNLIESRKLFSSCQKAVKNGLHFKKCASNVDHILLKFLKALCTNLRSERQNLKNRIKKSPFKKDICIKFWKVVYENPKILT